MLQKHCEAKKDKKREEQSRGNWVFILLNPLMHDLGNSGSLGGRPQAVTLLPGLGVWARGRGDSGLCPRVPQGASEASVPTTQCSLKDFVSRCSAGGFGLNFLKYSSHILSYTHLPLTEGNESMTTARPTCYQNERLVTPKNFLYLV